MTALAPRRFIDDLHAPFWVLVAGVLLGLSFPPSPLYGLAYVALVPVLVRWSRLPLGWMLLRETYSTFLIMTAIAGHWVLLHESALTALTSGLGLLLVPVPMTLPVVASALVKRRFGVRMGFVVLVSFWLAMEYVVAHGPGALPWLLLGHTQANASGFNQIADLAGVGGLTLWIWLVNGAVFWTLESRRDRRARARRRPAWRRRSAPSLSSPRPSPTVRGGSPSSKSPPPMPRSPSSSPPSPRRTGPTSGAARAWTSWPRSRWRRCPASRPPTTSANG